MWAGQDLSRCTFCDKMSIADERRSSLYVRCRGILFRSLLLALSGVVPLDLGDGDLACLSNSFFWIFQEFLEDRNRTRFGDRAHSFGSLHKQICQKVPDMRLIDRPTSCLTIGSSEASLRTFSSVGRAEVLLTCPRQYASSCFSRAESSAKPALLMSTHLMRSAGLTHLCR